MGGRIPQPNYCCEGVYTRLVLEFFEEMRLTKPPEKPKRLTDTPRPRIFDVYDTGRTNIT